MFMAPAWLAGPAWHIGKLPGSPPNPPSRGFRDVPDTRLASLRVSARQGIGAAMVRQLMARAPGQHIGLQTDDAEAFYTSLGYRHQPVFMSAIVGEWLVNEANQP